MDVGALVCKNGCLDARLIAYDNGRVLCLSCRSLQKPRRVH
jgi:hypothetical protein